MAANCVRMCARNVSGMNKVLLKIKCPTYCTFWGSYFVLLL